MKLPAFQFYPGDWRKDPSDSKIGMYVSACRRNYIKSQSSGGDQS